MAMFYSDYSTANEYLTYAFTECHVMSKKNKRWILLNLVPVKILLGYMPTREVLKKYDLLQLWEVVVAVKRGCISELSNAMQQHQTFFIKSGIYLIIEKLKIITYRNLAKKV
ncbi:PCI domain-containing protein 2-like [Homalodisca vitripennis]|nr:PCI domain-containing protein 2-like [Homalodisca vitripennis]